MIIFPKNRFQKLVSYAFERSLPTLQYAIWNPVTYHARKSGWTEQEKLHHNFWRGDYMMYHSYAQSMHPMGYLERSRADAFVRRVEDILPGIECPEWALHHKRAVDFDFEGAMNPYKAMDIVEEESTPKTHYGISYPTSICHVGNYRYLIGYWAQRLFYNEEIKGNLQNGYYTEEQKKNLNSFYANRGDYQKVNKKNLTPEEVQERQKNIDKWTKLIQTHYPEVNNYKFHAAPAKFDEPYYDRTVKDIINAIFIQKWSNALERGVFSQEELQSVYEFFLHQRDDVFWTKSEEDGLYHPTGLYQKFVKTLNVPSVFELDKYTSKVVEAQYNDKLQINYGINYSTVDQFRRQHARFLKDLYASNKLSAGDIKRLRALVSEEVYNPLFRSKTKSLSSGTSGSYVVAAYKEKGGAVLDALEDLHKQTQEELYFINRENQENFLARLRTVVKSQPFHASTVPKVEF